MSFSIQTEDRALSENVVSDLVEHSRANQVLNEEQAIVTVLTYLTGWFEDPNRYNAALISGGSSAGKTHMKRKVVDVLFEECPEDTLYETTSASGLAMQDDESWDYAKVAALNEMNQLEQDTIEFLKAVHADDGGSTRTRNVQDSDAEGGFDPVSISRDPKPYVMLFADENPADMEWELATRMMNVRVDSTVAKNRAVGKAQWGHESVELEDGGGDRYMFETDVTEKLQRHIAGLPEDVDVQIPSGDSWDAFTVIAPIFKWKRDDSTRASRMIANLVRASALLNYEHRERDGNTFVAEPQDLANVLSCRHTLLTTTHDMSPEKFAVVTAIQERGYETDLEGGAVGANVDTIREYLTDAWGGSAVSKTQLEQLLQEMVEHYILTVEELPDEPLYVYRGGEKLGHPNVGEYPELFESCMDPIRGQSITETVAQQRDELGGPTGGTVVTSEESVESTSFGDGQQTLVDDREPLSEVAQRVHTLIADTMETMSVPADEVEDLEYEHMMGFAPIERYTEDGTQLCRAERPPKAEDRANTVMDPHTQWWDGTEVDEADVRARVRAAVEELIDRGLVAFEEDGDVVNVHVEVPA